VVRALAFLVVVAALAGTAAWLADSPGSVTLHWQGWRLDTSVAVLIIAMTLIAAATALIYRLWLFLRRAPARLGQARREGRRRRGYLALTRGMVAVAAGDAGEADRQAKRAEVLLDEPPLTLLLSAQAAQLVGDESAAGRFFTAMLDRPETEFLGLRGLLNQANKRGDAGETLRLAERAYHLKPDSEWVAGSLFEQQVRAYRWADAEETLARAVKKGLVDDDVGRRRRAVLTHQRGLDRAAAGDDAEALTLARKAHELEPGFIPAAARLAALYGAAGKARKATPVIERAWRQGPHPALLSAYRDATAPADPLQWLKSVQRLAAQDGDEVESQLALARAALEARLWGEARAYLEGLAGDQAPARVCRLMAEIEESEHGNLAEARDWLVRATAAEADPAWVCGDCGNIADDWSAHCAKCGAFDGFAWRTPPHVLQAPPMVGPPPPALQTETADEPKPEPAADDGAASTP
jgi:HemY protein